MKKILFVAASAILLAAGCQKTEVLNQAVGDPMTFSTGMAKLTKSATANGYTNLGTQDFQVWAYTAYNDGLNGVKEGDIYEKINGIKVDYTPAAGEGTSANCSTTQDYYWPGKDLKLDFFAISSEKTLTSVSAPATADETEGGTGDDTDQGSTGENTETPADLSVSFENPGQTLGQRKMTLNGYSVTPANNANGASDDLMVAEFVRQDQAMGDPKKSVSLHFHHALSKVRFKFVTTKEEGTSSQETVEVTSFKVSGISTKGNLEVTEKTSSSVDAKYGRNDIDLSWKNVDVPSEFKYTETILLPSPEEWNQSYTTSGEAAYHATWLVIPQTIETLNIEIAYKITNGEKIVTATRLFPLSRAAGTDATGGTIPEVKAWGINKITTYTINISPNKISFNPSVKDWDDDETNIGQEN